MSSPLITKLCDHTIQTGWKTEWSDEQRQTGEESDAQPGFSYQKLGQGIIPYFQWPESPQGRFKILKNSGYQIY